MAVGAVAVAWSLLPGRALEAGLDGLTDVIHAIVPGRAIGVGDAIEGALVMATVHRDRAIGVIDARLSRVWQHVGKAAAGELTARDARARDARLTVQTIAIGEAFGAALEIGRADLSFGAIAGVLAIALARELTDVIGRSVRGYAPLSLRAIAIAGARLMTVGKGTRQRGFAIAVERTTLPEVDLRVGRRARERHDRDEPERAREPGRQTGTSS